jgi:hypothetical protein
MLLLFGGYQRSTDQIKYSKIITKPANLVNLDYLDEAPPRGSSLIFMLRKQTSNVNSILTSQIVVDIRYNGLLLNYCDNFSGEGCTWDQFAAKVRRLIYSRKEFTDHCDGGVDVSHKIALVVLMLLLVICMVNRCVKSIMQERIKSKATKNLIKRGILTPKYFFSSANNNFFSGELEVSIDGGLELGVDVDVNVEAEAPIDQGVIQMDETLDDIDVGATVEFEVDAPVVELQVEAEVEADVKLEVEGKFFYLKK